MSKPSSAKRRLPSGISFNKILQALSIFATVALALGIQASAQSSDPYPNAVTDRVIHPETPMAPPAVNAVFQDPDFGSSMVRVTDEKSDFLHPGGYVRTAASPSANMWAADNSKFYVIAEGGVALAYSFKPSTMHIGSLPGAKPGRGLHVPLRIGGSFSFTDPDLMYGIVSSNALTINSYRFSTGEVSTIVDTTTCGMQPPLVHAPDVRGDDDVTPTLDDSRISISEGGLQAGENMFVVVYDKKLGCRWYNTQTGKIGGQWGPSGAASLPDSYLIAHAYVSRSGKYVNIFVYGAGWYVWDLATLDVSHCMILTALHCSGYTGIGYNTIVQARELGDQMDIVKRPFGDIADVMPLVWPLPPPHYWGEQKHFTWSNVNKTDSTPVCASTYYYEDTDEMTQPFEGEILCIETDGVASTIWRFAHNRARYYTKYFNTQPLGSVSMDGRFLLFTSGWDEQLGNEANGTPRSDVWIVKLD